jgi:aspartyl-tRNA(Asn)/glutamyl-tRNA(Gln) amidotransferase subunit A
VVGIKPTYGAVSRYGLVAFASSLDQVGTLGRTVEDAAALLQAVAGHDARDSTSARRALPDLAARAGDGAEGLVVGVPEQYFPDDLDPAIRRLVEGSLESLAREGARIRPISLPNAHLGIPAYYVIAPAEASANLARYDGVRFGRRREGHGWVDAYERTRSAGFGAEVKRRILLGTFTLSAGHYDRYYGNAQRVRRLIAGDFDAAFAGGVDVILTPTTPEPAFPLGERARDPYRMYLGDIFTVGASLAGIPAASVPIGTCDGLPVGGQLMAAPWQEGVLVRAAAALERATRRRAAPGRS